jgi:hypothetical protein
MLSRWIVAARRRLLRGEPRRPKCRRFAQQANPHVSILVRMRDETVARISLGPAVVVVFASTSRSLRIRLVRSNKHSTRELVVVAVAAVPVDLGAGGARFIVIFDLRSDEITR